MFRVLEPDRHARVTYAELFFDLVFVFAVTQLSHTLLHHFTPLGAVQVTLLFLAVWWVWVYTTWVTNWLDPGLTPVRILLFLLMLGGLLLSTSIPKAFEERGLWFAGAYAAMQIGRTAFWLLATPNHRTPVRHNAVRILVWFGVSAVLWILGGIAEGERRLYFWMAALAIEYVAPAVRFWTPRLGFSSIEAWSVEGGHMAERCSLFIIIALGEALVVNGATFAELTWTQENVAAFLSALAGSIAIWWIYFNRGAEAGAEMISKSVESGRVARLTYTYLHMPIVAGIILAAVADELVLKHPGGHADGKTVLATVCGPLLFLIGTILFKHTIRGFLQLSHIGGIVALAAMGWFGRDLSPLWLSILTTAIMIAVAVWESLSLRAKPEA
ncbi:MAG: low temperature requirement protein A [Bradyrhizobium sp.]|nr:low temperature requirement protein A [Bradyrhizobium sp.]